MSIDCLLCVLGIILEELDICRVVLIGIMITDKVICQRGLEEMCLAAKGVILMICHLLWLGCD